MNNIKTINTDYLRPSRTLETIIVSNSTKTNVFYVYNYEGYSFRLFKTHLDFINFFQNAAESDFHFNSDNELDSFLEKVELID